MLIFKMRRKH